MDEPQKPRLTWQIEQEELSRLQFSQRLLEYGSWLTDNIKDVGEDLLIRIYEERVWSGLSFFVQLKSTKDIESLIIPDNVVSYSFEVKDLKHWSASAVPVFLVVWDVTKKFGHWISVLEAVAWLNKEKEGWQSGTSTQVWIPTSNATDDVGLKRIRSYLADYYLPSLSKEQSLDAELLLSIPASPSGQQIFEAMERFIDSGDTVEIDEEFIKSFRYSDWYTRIRGKEDVTKIVLSSTEGETIPQRVDVITRSGSIISLPYVELRRKKMGQKDAIISNEHQPIAVHVRIFVNFDVHPKLAQLTNSAPETVLMPVDPTKPAMAFGFGWNPNPKNVQDVKDGLLFFAALNEGAALRLVSLSTAKMQEFPAPPEMNTLKLNQPFAELIDKLCFIQQKTHCQLSLTEMTLDGTQAQLIYEVEEILNTGRVALQNKEVAVEFGKASLEMGLQALLTNQVMTYETHGAESQVNLLETAIPLGPATWKIAGVPIAEVHELEEIIGSMEDGQTREIGFRILQGTVEYEIWPQ